MLQKIITKTLVISTILTGCGVALLPSVSHANTCPLATPAEGTGDPLTASCDVNVSASVAKSISLAITDADGGSGTPTDPYIISINGVGGSSNASSPKTFSTKISTNDTAGYTLTIADADTDNSLTHTSIAAQTIPACTTLDGSASCWAVKSAYAGTHTSIVNSLSNFTAVPVSTDTPLILAEYTSSLDSTIIDDITTVSVGLSVANGQVAGSYQDGVVITAIAK